MKIEIEPIDVSSFKKLSPALASSEIPDDGTISSIGISKSGLWIWVVSDATINFYHVENNEWFGGYCFRKSLKNLSAKISAVLEFQSSHVAFPCLIIAVHQGSESLICMLEVNALKVVRSLLFPDLVLRLEVVCSNGGACLDNHHLFSQLRYMFGIIAVGTIHGHVYLLDLCLDEDLVCDENSPNVLLMVKKYELFPETRERIISKDQHIFMLLNDLSSQNGESEGQPMYNNLTNVQVSTIKFIHNTVTLAVGFNYGGIQLWDLSDLCLLFSVPNEEHELPVIALNFQEPENDPRNFCYLWVIKGFTANEKPDDFSVATMYSLTYRNRTFVESYGNVYTELQNCRKRFEHSLTSDPISSAQSSSSLGSCLLSCQIICQTDENHFMDAASTNDSETVPENTSLCFLSWVVWFNAERTPPSYHLALFDLNQWYQAQMPVSNLRSDPAHFSPYFAHYSLKNVATRLDFENILGFYILPHSIKKFRHTNPAEEFFYPSSLDFQIMAYSTSGSCKASYLGIQKSLLYKITEMGPRVLVNPREIFSDLMSSGLVSEASGSDRLPLITQREIILQLALEHHLPPFFMKCFDEWKYADSAQEGCTSRALLNWAWKRVFQIKSSIDKLNVPFFNCSGVDIDKTSLGFLQSYRRQMDLIDTIIMGYQKFAPPRTEQGFQELKYKKEILSCINMYLKVVLWLHSVHLLPEVCEGDETERNILYPMNALVAAYARRRNHLQKIHSAIGPTDILLIDGLVNNTLVDNSWPEKGGSGNYPPPSIYAALSCYLLDGIPLEAKHSLMYYLLLDISHSPHNVRNPLISEVKKFPKVFGMSQSVSQLIKAFWYLDQFKFEVALNNLLDPAVKPSDILPWQHTRVIKSFLYQNESHKALKYINHMDPLETSLEDMKLHLSVLLAKGAITQAFYYQRSKQAQGFAHELLNQLFLGCQETGKLTDLMYLPLNTLESGALINFLSENDDPRTQEALVMYYLLHCNFFEAAKVNEKIAMNKLSKLLSSQNRSVGRDALVCGLLSSVPSTERNLVQEVNNFQSVSIQNEESLQPLSLSVKAAPLKHVSNSDILNSLISGANASMCAPYLESRTPLKSRANSFYDNLPFLRPPLTPDNSKTTFENSFSSPVVKRTLISPSSEFSSPTKKSRLLDNAAFRSNLLSKKKIPKHLVGDVATLLQSPPIHRKVSKSLSESVGSECSPIAPQGILKKKAEPLNTDFQHSLYTAETPPLLSEASDTSENEIVNTDDMNVDEDVPGRQIRFNMPAKDEKSTLNCSMESSVLSLPSVSSPCVRDQELSIPSEICIKSDPSTKSFESRDRLQINASPKKTVLLTRSAIKSVSGHGEKLASDTELFPPFSAENNYSKVDSAFGAAPMEETFTGDVEIEDVNNEKKEGDTRVLSLFDRTDLPMEESSNSASSTVTAPTASEPTKDCGSFASAKSSDSGLNRSDCSSGNSSYNSISDRSLIVTPRRPLRDCSRSSSCSNLSSAPVSEEQKSATAESEKSSINVETKNYTSAENEKPVWYHEAGKTDDNEVVLGHFDNVKTEMHPVKSQVDNKIEKIKTGKLSFNVEAVEKNFPASVEGPSGEIEANDIEKSHLSESQADVQSVKSLIDNQIEKSLSQNYKPEASSNNTSLSFLEKFSVFEKHIVCSQKEDTKEIHPDKKVSPEISGSDIRCVEHIIKSTSDEVHQEPMQLDTVLESVIPSSDTDDLKLNRPVYVPIRERIRSSCKSVSDVGMDDCDELKPSVSELAEDVFKIEGLDSNEVSCTGQSSTFSQDKNDAANDQTPASATGLSNPILNTDEDYSRRITQRWNFLSRNSDFYENNRLLHQETVKLLQDNYIPENIEFDATKSVKKKSFNFEFSAQKSETAAKQKERKLQQKESSCKTDQKEESNTLKEYLTDSASSESYEQFSASIKKRKKDLSIKSQSTFISGKGKSSVKKTKGKGKSTSKMEFSFAEPLSPADPEILEALSTPHESHINSFMFSPPLTRGKLRQKRSEDLSNSSFASVASDTSFAKSRKPPVDPILEEIIAERSTDPKLTPDAGTTKKSKSKGKKAPTRKSKASVSGVEKTEQVKARLKSEDSNSPSKSKDGSTPKSSPSKHSMVLRHAKPKMDQLF